NLTITNKRLTIQGAGVGQTIIINLCPIAAYPTVDQMLIWKTKPGGVSRLTGIEFREGNRGGFPSTPGMIVISGTSDQFRLDHTKWTPVWTTAVKFHDYVRGVVDHNTFDVSTFRDAIQI